MKVRILLFARYAELAGCRELTVELPASATVGDAWGRLGELHPALGALRENPLAAVDQVYAQAAAPLAAGAELAFFPPVGGG